MLPPSEKSPSTTFDVVLAAFGALGYALSARALLLLALLGAFFLGYEAMILQTPLALATLATYGVIAVFPIAYLEIRKIA